VAQEPVQTKKNRSLFEKQQAAGAYRMQKRICRVIPARGTGASAKKRTNHYSKSGKQKKPTAYKSAFAQSLRLVRPRLRLSKKEQIAYYPYHIFKNLKKGLA